MRLLFMVVTVVTFILAIIISFFYFTRKTYPGFFRWVLGTCLVSIGFIFLMLRGIINDYLSIVIVNISFPLAVVLFLEGTRQFLGLSRMSRYFYIFPIIALIGSTYYYFVSDQTAIRNLITSIADIVPSWTMAYLIFKNSPKKESVFYPIIGILVFANGLLLLVRAIWVLLIPNFDIMAESPEQIGYYFILIALQIASTVSFVFLNSERLERELEQAESELRNTIEDLQKALAEVKTLGGLLPICASCKKIRDDSGYWHQIEAYISTHSDAEFSHGICPECTIKLYPELFPEKKL